VQSTFPQAIGQAQFFFFREFPDFENFGWLAVVAIIDRAGLNRSTLELAYLAANA
jgi:hypothetical protein